MMAVATVTWSQATATLRWHSNSQDGVESEEGGKESREGISGREEAVS